MKITIPEIPPSLNKYAGRANAWDYRAEKQRWLQLLHTAPSANQWARRW